MVYSICKVWWLQDFQGFRHKWRKNRRKLDLCHTAGEYRRKPQETPGSCWFKQGVSPSTPAKEETKGLLPDRLTLKYVGTDNPHCFWERLSGPCPNRASGNGEAYFSFSLFLDSGLFESCRLSSSHCWCLVATSLVLWKFSLCTLFWRNYSTITAIPFSLFLSAAFCFSFASRGFHALLLLRSSLYDIDALRWADTVTRWLTALFK